MDALIGGWGSAILRTTLCVSLAACVAQVLLTKLRIASPRTHRLAWGLVLLQGWLFVPWNFEWAVVRNPPPAKPISRPLFIETVPVDVALMRSVIREEAATGSWQFPVVCLLAWVAGLVAVLSRFAWNWGKNCLQLPLGSQPELKIWQREWDETVRCVGVCKRVAFRTTEKLGPLLCYLPFSYFVLVPRDLWASLEPQERQGILGHELAHLKRGDLWKSVAVRLLALPQWFNPLAWYAVNRFDDAGEWACDLWSARSSGQSATQYATTLLKVVEYEPEVTPAALALQGRGIARRIQRLIDPTLRKDSKMRTMIVPLVLCTLALGQTLRVKLVAAEETLAIPPTTVERVDPWNPYRIEAKDLLRIECDQLQLRVIVDEDGYVDLASYGRVRVDNCTVDEAEQKVTQAIASEHSDSEVDVEVLETLSKLAIVSFEYEPGKMLVDAYQCRPNSSLATLLRLQSKIRRTDLSHARVVVHHRELKPTVRDIEVLEFQASDVIENPDSEANCQILPGDQVEIFTSPAPTQSAENHWWENYVIEPPDLLHIQIGKSSRNAVVLPDGTVDLGKYHGRVEVVGLTEEAAQTAVAEALSLDSEVTVQVAERNSKVYYIISEDPSHTASVLRCPCVPQECLLEVLQRVQRDPATDLGSQSIQLNRSKWNDNAPDERTIDVNWSNLRENSDLAKLEILPGDRIIVQAKPIEIQKEPTAPPAPPVLPTAYHSEIPQISVAVQFVRDPEAKLSQQFSSRNHDWRFVDTPKLNAAISKLVAEGSVKVLAEPRVLIESGRTASVRINSADDQNPSAGSERENVPREIQLEVTAEATFDKDIQLEIRPRITTDARVYGTDASVSVTDPNTSVLLKLPGAEEDKDSASEICVTVTTELTEPEVEVTAEVEP